MTLEECVAATVPFAVRSKHGKKPAIGTIIGFTRTDPLDEGGLGSTLLGNFPTAYFEGGGWCLVADLLRHWDLAPTEHVHTWVVDERIKGLGQRPSFRYVICECSDMYSAVAVQDQENKEVSSIKVRKRRKPKDAEAEAS